VLALLDDFVDLPGLETASADLEPLDFALHEGPEGHEVGKPAPLAHVVGVTDLVPHRRALSADVATLSHPDSSRVNVVYRTRPLFISW
jgi:hypothetical protein